MAEESDPLARLFRQRDEERAQIYPAVSPGTAGGRSGPRKVAMPMPGQAQSTDFASSVPKRSSRNGSWDLLAGVRRFEHRYEQFDPRNASQSHLAFAEGDVPKNKVRLV